MIGKLNKIELKEFKTKDGKKSFQKYAFECDVIINEKNDVKTLRGDYSVDLFNNYIEKVITTINNDKIKTLKDLIGKKVYVVVDKRAYFLDEEIRTYSYIKYLKFLDFNNNIIY